MLPELDQMLHLGTAVDRNLPSSLQLSRFEADFVLHKRLVEQQNDFSQGSDEQTGLIPSLRVYFLQKAVLPLEICGS